MATVEQRLSALEKRVRVHNEQILALFGGSKGLALVIDSLGAAVCAKNKPLLRTVIGNLRDFEAFCRMQNDHDLTISRLRAEREFFQGRLDKADGAVTPPSPSGSPRRGR